MFTFAGDCAQNVLVKPTIINLNDTGYVLNLYITNKIQLSNYLKPKAKLIMIKDKINTVKLKPDNKKQTKHQYIYSNRKVCSFCTSSQLVH